MNKPKKHLLAMLALAAATVTTPFLVTERTAPHPALMNNKQYRIYHVKHEDGAKYTSLYAFRITSAFFEREKTEDVPGIIYFDDDNDGLTDTIVYDDPKKYKEERIIGNPLDALRDKRIKIITQPTTTMLTRKADYKLNKDIFDEADFLFQLHKNEPQWPYEGM